MAGDTNVTTTVTDNDTETTLTLNNVTVNEGTGTATLSGTLSSAPTDEPLVIALDNGATLTFGVGMTTATSTEFAVQGDDVYIDGESITVNASVQSGGDEFENLNVDDTATVTVNDTVDTVTVGLTATASVAEGGQITYTATLTDANGAPVTTNNAITVTLANGEVITIAANSSAGEITVDAPVDDAYVTDAITNSIATASEANAGTPGALENLEVAGDTNVTTTVTDNDTETTLTLNNVTVNEGTGTATLSGTLSSAPTDEPLVIALDNGATLTFGVGMTTATSTEFAVQGDDVYIDGESITVNASVQSGGDEFENLNVDDTATVTVNDTVDTVTVGLTATASVAEGGQITYTATLTDANGAPVTTNNAITVTLANGEVITIAANSSAGEITVDAPVPMTPTSRTRSPTASPLPAKRMPAPRRAREPGGGRRHQRHHDGHRQRHRDHPDAEQRHG